MKYPVKFIPRLLKRGVVSIVALGSILLLWFTAHTAYVVYVGTSKPVRQADVAVVFGTAVLPSGKMSKGLEQRVYTALTLFQKGMVGKIVVTGGKSWSGHNEGSAMRDYLVAKGVPADKIIVDNDGNDTWASVENLQRLQQKHGFQSVIAVSHYYHLARIKTSLQRAGFTDVQTASPAVYRDKKSLLREFAAYYGYLVIH